MRSYSSDKPVSPRPLRPVPVQETPADLAPWTDGQLLHDLKVASSILTAQLGGGYSYDEMRRSIISGTWQERVHYWKKGRRYKVNIHRIINWQLSQLGQ